MFLIPVKYAAYPHNFIFLAVEFPMTKREFNVYSIVFSTLTCPSSYTVYVNAFIAMWAFRNVISLYVSVYNQPAVQYRFNARHHLQATMEKTTNASNLDVIGSGPVTFKKPGRQYFDKNNKSAQKPSLAGTLVFSHSIVESDSSRSLPTEESMTDGSRSQLRERRDGDSCVWLLRVAERSWHRIR